MISKKFVYPFILVAVSIFMIIAVQKQINQIREQEKFVSASATEELPPSIAFVNVGLGAFKGIFSDILWLKALSLQEQGKYFEMGKIAFWITKLNPQFTGATTFLSWNMAYNISIMFANPEDKWKWIQNAINVLREAITYNPGAPELYKELAWIYLNKIGDVFDSGNLYYKTQIAFEMERITGKNPTDEFWESLTSTKSSDEEVILARKFLKDDFMLDPKYIVQINQKFGNLDWKVSQSLAVYWAYRAMLIDPKAREYYKTLMMALTAYSYNGKIIYWNNNDYSAFTSIPDFLMILRLNSYFTEELNSQNRERIANLYYTFLNKAIGESCLFGRLDVAETLFNTLKNYYTNVDYANFKEYFEKYISDYISENNQSDFIEALREHLRIAVILNSEKNKESENVLKIWELLYQKYRNLNPNSKLLLFDEYFDIEKINFLKLQKS